MNWTIYALECAAAVLLFTGAILIPLSRNPIWWIHDYPKDIQDVYFETHDRIPTEPLSAPVLIKKSAALLLALALLTGLVRLAGAHGFGSAFAAAYGIWMLLNGYDCFFLDWVIFANWRRIRLPGTEHMDDAYHQKTYHAVRAGIGMILGLLPCLLCGLIVMVIG